MQRLCDARAALVSGSACASKDGKRKPSAATLPVVKAGAAIGPIVPAAASCVPPAVIAVQGLVEDIFRYASPSLYFSISLFLRLSVVGPQLCCSPSTLLSALN